MTILQIERANLCPQCQKRPRYEGSPVCLVCVAVANNWNAIGWAKINNKWHLRAPKGWSKRPVEHSGHYYLLGDVAEEYSDGICSYKITIIQ